MSQADFLKHPFPEAQTLDDLDLSGPGRFVNRELSWLAFNWRVLEEAENPRVPLLERLRFLSISAGNLDEFYTVRVAGLRELAIAGNTTPAADGLTPAEQLVLINENARALMLSQQRVLSDLLAEMEAEGIDVLKREELTSSDKTFLADYFLNHVFAVLSPLAIDPAHPFPFIPNTGFALALQLERKSDKRPLQALLPIPAQIDRFVALPGQGTRFLPLEELLVEQIGTLFPGYQLTAHFEFQVLRDSDLEVEDEAEDLVREFEVALKRRRRGEVVRMLHSAGAPERLKSVIMRELNVMHSEVIEIDGMIGFRRRYVRRDPSERHAAASPLRDLRDGDPVPATGGARPECGGDQTDAVPHLETVAHCRGLVRGGRGRQVGDGAGRVEGPL
mgnify:CR=1 FL=1